MNNIFGLLISFVYIGLVIGISAIFTKLSKEASRKFIHIMLSNWWIIAMVFFNNVWFAALGPAVFVVINFLSYKYNIIKVMERDDSAASEKTLGTVFYAISLLVLVILTFGINKQPILGLIGALVMGYGDGFAAIAGQSIKSKEYHVFGSKKTVAGSIVMFLISGIIIASTLFYLNVDLWILKTIIIAILVTLLEAISPKGSDNLTVPIAATLLAWMML